MRKILLAAAIALGGVYFAAGQAQAANPWCLHHPADPRCVIAGGNNPQPPPPPGTRPPRGHVGGQFWHDGNGGYRWRHGIGPDWFFNFQFDPYDPGFHSFRDRCDGVARSLSRSGFRNVQPVTCIGRIYIYNAQKNGEKLRIVIDSRTGRIITIRHRP